jgi:hypothetical protein
MKANEAPKKIYVDSKAIGDDISTTVHTKRQDYPTCIEYTRTDAFIDKAAEWLNNFYNEDTHSCLIDEDIEKFINYMKGE